jgi:hypothetical protein
VDHDRRVIRGASRHLDAFFPYLALLVVEHVERSSGTVSLMARVEAAAAARVGANPSLDERSYYKPGVAGSNPAVPTS